MPDELSERVGERLKQDDAIRRSRKVAVTERDIRAQLLIENRNGGADEPEVLRVERLRHQAGILDIEEMAGRELHAPRHAGGNQRRCAVERSRVDAARTWIRGDAPFLEKQKVLLIW